MKVILKNARLSFNDLFEPKIIGDSKEPKFSATAICLNGDEEGNPDKLKTVIVYENSKGERVTKPYSKLMDICEHVMEEKLGKIPAKHVNWVLNKADGSTTRDEQVNSDGDFWEGFNEDTWFVSATKQEKLALHGQITVLDQLKKPIEANSGEIYSGCFVNLVIDVYAFKAKPGSPAGVTASLEGVQKKDDGEPLGFTRIDAADEFEVEEINDADDEAADLI